MRRNSGQIIVFVLLIMLLGLTVGLSVTSRTIQDLKQSSMTDQSSRAFTAAEAGLENALSRELNAGDANITINPNLSDFSGTVSYDVSGVGGASYAVDSIVKDDVVTVRLDNYTGTSVDIWWTAAGTSEVSSGCTEGATSAALEMTMYYLNGTSYGSTKQTYNPPGCGTLLSAINNFSNAGTSGDPKYISNANFSWASVSPALPNPIIKGMLRLRPIYRNASILIKPTGSASLPQQGFVVTSTAQTTGGVSRSVQIASSSAGLAPIFDYVLYSNNNIPN